MTDERMIEEMAKLEGLSGFSIKENGLTEVFDEKGTSYTAPDYLTDHNAVQRIIDGMDDKMLVEYSAHVGVVVTNDTLRGSSMSDSDIAWLICKCCLKSTPRQKRIAILKAYGKWEGEE